MEAIYKGTFNVIKFRDDIDNSEEDDLSDEDLKARIKERKAKERALRAHIGIVRAAAKTTMENVEGVRKSLKVYSVVDKYLDLKSH